MNIYEQKKTIIPIGSDCTVAHYLRKNDLRQFAYPFDWCVTPISSALDLILQNFKGYADELIYLPKQNRMLFDEDSGQLKILETEIIPAVCKRYKILFPHDFTPNINAERVRDKYQKRIERLLNTIKQNSVIFVYSEPNLNEWQIAQYEKAGVIFPSFNSDEINLQLKNINNKFKTEIEMMSFVEFKLLVN